MYELLKNTDARTMPAEASRMEILLFSLGTDDTFGINVFNVREVCKTPAITRAPHMPDGVEGLISLRGNIIPVVSLAKAMHLTDAPPGRGESMMVIEYGERTFGFLVHGVDRIISVDRDRVLAPEVVASGTRTYITAMTKLDSGGLVSIVDVEVLADTLRPLLLNARRN
ncbi:MAG: chemotaxis protein CheW [Rhodocyclaceae bacterium]|nr:chemotaxis protein CheW [Rhodocyclaceae bacterium]